MKRTPEQKKIAWSLWIPVIFAFLLVICAWAALIKVAKDNPVKQINVGTEAPQASPEDKTRPGQR